MKCANKLIIMGTRQAYGRIVCVLLIVGAALQSSVMAFTSSSSSSAASRPTSGAASSSSFRIRSSSATKQDESSSTITSSAAAVATAVDLFDDFVEFLLAQQEAIIAEIEGSIERTSGATFSKDPWGVFSEKTNDNNNEKTTKSGGITRVMQGNGGGAAIEKGACSLTLIRDGMLTAERAATIRARQPPPPPPPQSSDSAADDNADANDAPQQMMMTIQAGDTYSAAALSMVLHSRSPMVPTFRSDVRVFLVTDRGTGISWAWFGGGADLTPYYLFPDDVTFFHRSYQQLCAKHATLIDDEPFSYEAMKQACDAYFYLPARQEHRGTGGIFFDDLTMTPETLAFTKGVTETWMPSWLPIVAERGNTPYTNQQKQWQKLRRGRYLEFNLLYDRGVKFGLQTPNPRVEGVMVSAPPEIAYEYNHQVEPGSPEAALVEVLKTPQAWV